MDGFTWIRIPSHLRLQEKAFYGLVIFSTSYYCVPKYNQYKLRIHTHTHISTQDPSSNVSQKHYHFRIERKRETEKKTKLLSRIPFSRIFCIRTETKTQVPYFKGSIYFFWICCFWWYKLQKLFWCERLSQAIRKVTGKRVCLAGKTVWSSAPSRVIRRTLFLETSCCFAGINKCVTTRTKSTHRRKCVDKRSFLDNRFKPVVVFATS